jgi:hypothetical protein
MTMKALSMSPLFRPLWPALSKFEDYEKLPSVAQLNQQLCIDGIHFVSQCQKTADFADGYEPRIYLQGEVQTRDQSWHDFFNALVWQQFPQSKKIINQLHYQLQKQRYPDKRRLQAENMLTLFDENGALVISENPHLLELIRQQRWHELFWRQRDAVRQQLKVIIFGHGLYEKLLQPYIGITAKALLFNHQDVKSLDALLEKFIAENNEGLEPKMLSPLPILGVPDWWPENEMECFYANKAYFREKIAVDYP